MFAIRDRQSESTAEMSRSDTAWPVVRPLLALFDEQELLEHFEGIEPGEVPEPYRSLLVHHDHMTLAQEAHHGSPVEVNVMATRVAGGAYARRSLLTLRTTGRVVQHCTARIALDACCEAVRRDILEESVPLGYILVRHNVMRRVEPTRYLRIRGGEAILREFDAAGETVVYGRTATIYCARKPMIDVLEIVAPERGTIST